MYYTIETKTNESHTIFVQFFTESKKESENYSVRLSRDTKTGSYKCESVLQTYSQQQKWLNTMRITII